MNNDEMQTFVKSQEDFYRGSSIYAIVINRLHERRERYRHYTRFYNNKQLIDYMSKSQ